ncbi:hypothetical protein AK830_g6053 [Neonectria ditissima]|uniref:FAD-binding domain-containing protein n=1 Tax=Neonectria ditissima TaxID=78410 RepID=A0A0P7B264_9HYPO|nr:hypothetical protein AK830_g6053 [Neonectria ditissima]
MSSSNDFKIIIAGGGIAGLTLAILLEKFNIDYLLLEAHDDISPPVGASIGLMPNGLLILDQIGCYDAIRVVAQAGEFDNLHIRAKDGKSMKCTEHMFGHMEKRHGYPMVFFDRQWLLQVLYSQIKHKEKVVLQSQVDRIDCEESGIKVSTKAGQVYHGTMIIGADGIHSAVRREMSRIAGETQPGYFPAGEEDRVPCYYQCSFGIAHKVVNWPEREQSFTTGDQKAFLVTSGPEDRVYWFLFVKLPETKYGKDIPKYTKEDEALFVKQHQALPITENLTFGQLYHKRLTSALTPLHEVVFEKWFYNRMLLIGDSAHKPNPIGGMGANGAMESVAEFINALLEKRDKRPEGLRDLTTADINTICQQMQSARHDRAKFTVSSSNKMQAILAFEKPWVSNLVWRAFSPLAGDDSPLRVLSARIVGGSRVNKLPIPSRPRAIPFIHELPAHPSTGGRARIISWLYTAVMALLLGLLWDSQQALSYTISGGHPGFFSRKIDNLEPSLQEPTLGFDSTITLWQMYLLSQSISPLLTYAIEGNRVGNKGLPFALSHIFMVGLQVLGVSRAVPLIALVTASLPFDAPAGRFIQPEVGKCLVPALVLGYIFPTILMLAPFAIGDDWKKWAGVVPFLFSALTVMLPSFLKLWTVKKDTISTPYLNRYKASDVASLQFTYGFAFAFQAAAHWATLLFACTYAEGLSATVLDLFVSEGNNGTLQRFLSMGISDVLLTTLVVTIHNFYFVWDLRRAGYTANRETFWALLSIIAGQILAGPGAAWAGLWSWREIIVSGLSKTE